MKFWIMIAGCCASASLASAATPAGPLIFPPNAEATESRISSEVGPMLRAWARSEASYATHVAQVGPDLHHAFPQIEVGTQSDAVIFLTLMEKLRVEHGDVARLEALGALSSDQQAALQSAESQYDQAQAMIASLLPSLGPSADAAIMAIKR
jgi:hypothetical protein